MECLTSDADIDLVQIGDTTVELVGVVESKNAPQQVGRDKSYTVMKFLISNRKGKIIQCSAWDGDVSAIEPKIQPGKIIHINGAYASLAKPQFNKGNVRFELSMKKHTEINIIEDDSGDQPLEIDPVNIELGDLANYIIVDVNLKTPFQVISHHTIASYGCAAVCAQGFKVDVKISAYDHTQGDNNNYKVGDALKIKGIPREEIDKYGVSRLFIELSSIKDIEKLPGNTKSFREMIKCVNTPKRKVREESAEEVIGDKLKKSKLEN